MKSKIKETEQTNKKGHKLIAEQGGQRYTVFIFLMSLKLLPNFAVCFGVEVMIIFKIHSVEALSDSPCTSFPLSL